MPYTTGINYGVTHIFETLKCLFDKLVFFANVIPQVYAIFNLKLLISKGRSTVMCW